MGANLFIGNLDENVDERLLYDTFTAFGILATTAKVCRSVFQILHLPFIMVSSFSRFLGQDPLGVVRASWGSSRCGSAVVCRDMGSYTTRVIYL